VSIVELTRPPITTLASGLCTSAPVEVESAIGIKPKLATNAVINTGRRQRRAPAITALPNADPASRNCLMERRDTAYQAQPVLCPAISGARKNNKNGDDKCSDCSTHTLWS
jgi:hypothetical protein